MNWEGKVFFDEKRKEELSDVADQDPIDLSDRSKI